MMRVRYLTLDGKPATAHMWGEQLVVRWLYGIAIKRPATHADLDALPDALVRADLDGYEVTEHG